MREPATTLCHPYLRSRHRSPDWNANDSLLEVLFLIVRESPRRGFRDRVHSLVSEIPSHSVAAT